MQGPTTETGGEARTSISIITRTLGSPLLAEAEAEVKVGHLANA